MRSTHDEDAVLANRHAPARESAGDRLVREWLPVVVRWCARLGGPGIDAEDVAHDVFIVALRKQQEIYDESHTSAWLFGVTRRVLAQHRRRAWFRRWLPGVVTEAVDPVGPARIHALSETAAQVHVALQQLAEREREVLVLSLLEERPDSEVSAMLGIPIGTVKSRLRRAREQFLVAASSIGLTPGLEGEE